MLNDNLANDIIGVTPLLRAYAIVLTNSRSHADDLVQDTLERAWRHRSEFTPGSSLKAWLFSILRNRFTDEFRRNRHTIQDVDGDYASKLVTLPDQHWRLQYNDLFRAIDGLAPGVRDALLLVAGAGLSHQEAAAVLDCPLGTVKSRIRRARSQLLETVEIEHRAIASGCMSDCE